MCEFRQRRRTQAEKAENISLLMGRSTAADNAFNSGRLGTSGSCIAAIDFPYGTYTLLVNVTRV